MSFGHGDSNEQNFERLLKEIDETSKYLLEKTDHRPKIAIICGTGLGTLPDQLTDSEAFSYTNIPHCVQSSVLGHEGRLVFGKLAGVEVVCMQGRIHAYEGHTMWKITFLVRVFDAIGVKLLIVTNAAGGLNADYKTGDIVVIKDHINLPGLAGLNPLIGLNDDRFGPRFVAMSAAYDKDLRRLALDTSNQLNLDFKEGVYCYQTGPFFESVTECRYMKLFGADLAGMSTVPEVLVAVQRNLRVLGFSVVTNMCVLEYDAEDKAEHSEILIVGKMATQKVVSVLTTLLPKISATLK